jgi:hypothetical protein
VTARPAVSDARAHIGFAAIGRAVIAVSESRVATGNNALASCTRRAPVDRQAGVTARPAVSDARAELVSQPLAAFVSQSANPGLQLATTHWPAVHAELPLAAKQA